MWVGRVSTGADLFAGRYQLEALLGRGAFGTVHRAFDTRLKRPIALKIPHRLLASDIDFLETFHREAEVAAALNHPNIVTIYDVGESEDGLPYLAMRLLEGRSLRQVLVDEGGLTLDRSLRILEQLAAALDYLQDHHLVHRDIKPANVMVGDADAATLMDFGLARSLSGTHLSLTGSFLAFTPLYASPEQVAGERLTPASDRYSFAVVVYETLTGRAPHANFDSQLLLHAIRFEPPPPAEEINGALTREAGAVLLAALAKQPEERPGSAWQIVRDLRVALSRSRPISPAGPIGLDLELPDVVSYTAPEPIVSPPHRSVMLPSETQPDAPASLAAQTEVQPHWRPAAVPGLERLPAAPTVVQPASRALPIRVPHELEEYASVGVERVEVFGRGDEVCPTCAEVRARTYGVTDAPVLPLRGCSSLWGCHCEYAPLPSTHELPQSLFALLNPGQRSRVELARLRDARAQSQWRRIRIVTGPDSCLVCQDASRVYEPGEELPTLPLYRCRRYPSCECRYELIDEPPAAQSSLFDAVRRLGWPWRRHSHGGSR